MDKNHNDINKVRKRSRFKTKQKYLKFSRKKENTQWKATRREKVRDEDTVKQVVLKYHKEKLGMAISKTAGIHSRNQPESIGQELR